MKGFVTGIHISKTLSSLAGPIQHYTVPTVTYTATARSPTAQFIHSYIFPASPQLIHCLTQSVYSDLTISL